MTKVVLLLFSILFVFVQTCRSEPWGPWSNNPEFPVIDPSGKADRAREKQREKPSHGIAETPFMWLLAFYQKAISPLNNGKCPMYPTCSQYAVEAVRKHGPVVGIVMTADRLIHETSEQDHVPRIQVGGRLRFADPVENNDFWWCSK